jgi:hypothetical protein
MNDSSSCRVAVVAIGVKLARFPPVTRFGFLPCIACFCASEIDPLAMSPTVAASADVVLGLACTLQYSFSSLTHFLITLDRTPAVVLLTPPSSRGAANFFDTHIKGTARRGSRFEACHGRRKRQMAYAPECYHRDISSNARRNCS